MAWLCWHYHFGPRDLDGISDDEYAALFRFANREIKRQNRAVRQAKRG